MITPQAFQDHEAMSQAAAAWLGRQLQKKPDSTFCLATGATPMRSYEILAAQHAGSPTFFSRLHVLKLDEWGGIPMNSPASCETALRKSFIDPLRLQNRFTGFNSQPDNPAEECRRVQQWLESSTGIDVCVLGLGLNGHLGFNEPSSFLQPHCHVARLSPESLQHSMLQSEPVQPTFGLTLGIGDILNAREILLLVNGVSKRQALAKLLTPEIDTRFPASFLWLHPRLTLFCDNAALGR